MSEAGGDKIRCDACPVLCYIREGLAGACDRYANVAGRLVRVDPHLLLERTVEGGGDLVPFQARNIGFAIGLTVGFDILAAGAITGASMNPARSFGPAFVYKLTGGAAGGGAFDLHWCYWAAPIAGAVVGALVYENLILGTEGDG